MERRAELIPINEAVTLISDANESTYYIVCGTEKALMIDTGNGYEDVMEIAREITQLPIEVINTHGHCDHVYGNAFCKEAWIHPKDIALCKEHFSFDFLQEINHGATCCSLHPVKNGQVFDLGGLTLEVVELFGHTPGSIGLLDRKHRILFSGDALNPYIWLQLKESLPIEEFCENINDFLKKHGDEFDSHLSGHTRELIPKSAIYELLKGCEEILAGDTKNDIDYEWFDGVDKAHLYGNKEGFQICYNEDNICKSTDCLK